MSTISDILNKNVKFINLNNLEKFATNVREEISDNYIHINDIIPTISIKDLFIEFDYSKYLTFIALEDDFNVIFEGNDVQYCIDGGEWTSLQSGINSPNIKKNQSISFKANLNSSNTNQNTNIPGIGTFIINKSCDLSGNCMSLIFGDEAHINFSLYGYDNIFSKLFYYCRYLRNVSKDFLPATELGKYCYNQMFSGCNQMISAPELPATTLAEGCYSKMFSGCTALVDGPSQITANTLPEYSCLEMFYDCDSLTNPIDISNVTTLSENCCEGMFRMCDKLTKSPVLNAKTLQPNCYLNMFQGCMSLCKVKMYADTDAEFALSNWLADVAPTGTLYKKADTNWMLYGSSSGIPTDWSVVNI